MRKMSFSNDLPERCQKCAKSTISSGHSNCRFCLDIGIQEEILCYLNRCIQEPAKFECHAFQPIMKLVKRPSTEKTKLNTGHKEPLTTESINKFLKSDRIQYKRALALQKLNSDPNGVFLDIKYHLVWNVTHRRPIFKSYSDIFSFVYGTFSKCSELLGGFVSLLWLAPDHVHLYYVDSDGELSVEKIVEEIKQFSRNEIYKELTGLKEEFLKEIDIWDEAYFSETIG